MQTNSCAFGTWIVLATLLAPGAARSADETPVPAQAQPPAHVERLVPVFRLAPEYPRSAARNGISGVVEFLVTVNPDGSVRELRVIKAEPAGVFEAAASKALMRWKFKPKLVDGKPVEASGTQQIVFELDSPQQTSKDTACEKLRKPARKAGTMSERSFKGLEAAIALVGQSDFAGAEAALLELTRSARNDYERAAVLQMLGYVYVRQQKDDKAISSYEQALATNALSWATHDEITFALAKLYLISGKQEQGMQLLDAHLREACRPSPDAGALKQKLAPPPPSP